MSPGLCLKKLFAGMIKNKKTIMLICSKYSNKTVCW